MRSRGVIVLIGVLVLAVATDVAVSSSPPGLTAVTALLGAVALILFSKGVLKALIRRPVDYYERLWATHGPGGAPRA